MEFELMIPFGVVIIIFATIICRKYIFIKKSDEDIITCDEGEDNFKINKNYSEDIARINIVDYKENNSEDTMEDLVRERDYDDYSRSMEESIIKTSARYYEEKKEKEEEERKLKEKEHEKEVLQQSEKENMRLVDEVRRRSLNEVIAEAELKAKRRKKMDEKKKTRKMTEHHMER